MIVLSIQLLTPVDIVIDSREDSKNPVFRGEFIANGLKVAVQSLPVGDFLLLTTPASGKKPILIERKTVYDLANSIRDNRLWDQAKLLVEASIRDNYQPFILIEGYLGRLVRERSWSIQSILRAIDTLMLDFNIPVLNTTGKKSTIVWIIAKARSLGRTEDKRIFRLRVEKKPLTIHDRILYVAEGLVGPITARKLLQHFKTIKNIANASVRELMLVESIGEKRASEIYAIFNTEWIENGEVSSK